jgi:hypothetical protein
MPAGPADALRIIVKAAEEDGFEPFFHLEVKSLECGDLILGNWIGTRIDKKGPATQGRQYHDF